MDPRPFHATVPKSRGSRKAVIWHQRDLSEVVCEHRGFRVTTPERTYQDLASLLPLADLVAVADHLLRHKLLGADQLARVPPVPGSALLRRAAEMADPASASPKESTLRVEMLTRGLPVPRLNLEIIEDGGWIGCGDFVWPKWKVIADYDGEHHADPKQRAQDNATRDDYAHYGWRHVALDKKQITHMDKAIERVASALRDRGWQPGRDAGPVWHKAPKART
jgi:hypothetical protein